MQMSLEEKVNLGLCVVGADLSGEADVTGLIVSSSTFSCTTSFFSVWGLGVRPSVGLVAVPAGGVLVGAGLFKQPRSLLRRF